MIYISLLRGINVSGQKKIKMADLKSLYESLGFQEVTTYIQSGNVVFHATVKSQSALKKKIEGAIEKKYHFHVPVEIRTHREIRAIIENCPFHSVDLAKEGTKILVAFLSSKPPEDRISHIQKYVSSSEELVVRGREVYLYCPNGFGKSKLSNNFLEHKLGVEATTRNWKSVNKLSELSV